MLYENRNKTGGIAITGGTGGFPGYHEKDKRIDSFRNYYIYVPATIPFLDNMLSWVKPRRDFRQARRIGK